MKTYVGPGAPLPPRRSWSEWLSNSAQMLEEIAEAAQNAEINKRREAAAAAANNSAFYPPAANNAFYPSGMPEYVPEYGYQGFGNPGNGSEVRNRQ